MWKRETGLGRNTQVDLGSLENPALTGRRPEWKNIFGMTSSRLRMACKSRYRAYPSSGFDSTVGGLHWRLGESLSYPWIGNARELVVCIKQRCTEPNYE